MQHSLTGGAPSPRPWDRPGVLGAGAVRSASRAAAVLLWQFGDALQLERPDGPNVAYWGARRDRATAHGRGIRPGRGAHASLVDTLGTWIAHGVKKPYGPADG
jgi:hypothetical protein